MTDLGNYTTDETITLLLAPSTGNYSVKIEFNKRVFNRNVGEVTSGQPISIQASSLNEDYIYCAKVFNSDATQVGDDYRFRILSPAQ